MPILNLLKILILIFLLFPLRGYGQLQQAFDHYNAENGLSNNSVLCIIQDHHGFMWFGTRNGLNRFDGHSFKSYFAIAGDSSKPIGNHIIDLLPDSEKTLWLATADGLSKYNEETDSFKYIPVQERAKLTEGSSNITCIFESRKKQLWVGTRDGLFLMSDKKKESFNRINILWPSGKKIAHDEINALFQDSNDHIWVGTREGLIEIFPDLVKMRFFIADPGKPGSINDNHISCFGKDLQNRMWVGTLKGGLNLYDGKTSSFRSFTSSSSGIAHNNIRKIVADKSGMLWVGTFEGLTIFDPVNFTARNYRHSSHDRRSLSQNSIYALYRDANESIWIGTYYAGINVFHPQNIPFRIFQNSIHYSSVSNDVVSSFMEDHQGNIWVGTEGGGLNYLRRDKSSPVGGQFTVFKHVPGNPYSLGSNNVKTIFKDKDQNIWVGTHAGGLNLYEGRGKFKRYLFKENDSRSLKSEISSILEDSQGRFWVATQADLKLFKRTGRSLDSLPNTYFTDPDFDPQILFESRDQTVWMGAYNRLARLKKGQAAIEPYPLRGLSTRFINCIIEDKKGRMWLGTDIGLVWLKPGGPELLTRKDGLPNNYILGILEDKNGFLWISTSNGLSRFNTENRTFRTYTTVDGLPGNEFSVNAYYKNNAGELFFGGINGFLIFNPNSVISNDHRAPLRFTGVSLFNDVIETGGPDNILDKNIIYEDEISVDYDQNDLSFNFALLNFVRSQKNHYAYFLEGFSKTWSFVNTPSAYFNRLPPGSYTLWVKGANDDGIWSKPISLRVNVRPPFWKTWWAYSTYLFTLIMFTFFLSRFFYLRALIDKENELHMFKVNFFTNISHEIRTHLSLITGPLERLIQKNGEEKNVETIKRNFDNLLKLVNELMDFRKAETGNLHLNISLNNLVPFVENIFNSFENVFETKHITRDFTSSSKTIELYFDRDQLEKVFFNLLSNAFKFTFDNGRISLGIIEKDQTVEIHVEDNGKGISPENIDKLFVNYFQEKDSNSQNTGYGIGLAFSKSIVELHNGTLKADSRWVGNEWKTTFTISLLKGKYHFTSEQLKNDQTDSEILLPVISNDLQEVQEHHEDHSKAYTAGKDKEFTVLIVEDNPEIRSFVADLLTIDYRLLVSENGLAGWEMASNHIPDLIISDVMMPEMNGFELCKKLKTDIRTSHIPVILLTAKSYGEDQISGLEFGADVYLTKPFSTRVLELQVRNLLQSRALLLKKFTKELSSLPAGNDDLIPENAVDDDFFQKLRKMIEDNMDNMEFTVTHMSKEIGMSQPVLYKKVKAITGMTVNDFVKSLKMKKAANLLRQRNMTVYEVSYAIGYDDWKYFSKEFKKHYGVSPGKFGR